MITVDGIAEALDDTTDTWQHYRCAHFGLVIARHLLGYEPPHHDGIPPIDALCEIDEYFDDAFRMYRLLARLHMRMIQLDVTLRLNEATALNSSDQPDRDVRIRRNTIAMRDTVHAMMNDLYEHAVISDPDSLTLIDELAPYRRDRIDDEAVDDYRDDDNPVENINDDDADDRDDDGDTGDVDNCEDCFS